jgi:hypothetical protein
MGFRKDYPDRLPKSFLTSFSSGAVDPDGSEPSILKAFQLYFTDELLEHMVEKTNAYARKYSICYLPHQILEVTKQDILNYWVIFWIQGIVKCSRREDYWVFPQQNQGMTFNELIASTMPLTKWKKIDRCLQAKLKFISDHVNETSKKYWNVGKKVSFDDDLDLWKGKRGYRVYLPRKADRTGQLSWKVVDEQRYCWHTVFIADTPCPQNQSAAGWYLKQLDQSLPNGPYQITIDAGLLGSFKNADYLLSQGRDFIMSVASNKGKAVWKYLKKDLNLHHWRDLGKFLKLLKNSPSRYQADGCLYFLCQEDHFWSQVCELSVYSARRT